MAAIGFIKAWQKLYPVNSFQISDLSWSFLCFESPPSSRKSTQSLKHTVQEIHRKVTRVCPVGTFEVCVPTHVGFRMFIMQVLASQLHFLSNKNVELAVSPCRISPKLKNIIFLYFRQFTTQEWSYDG